MPLGMSDKLELGIETLCVANLYVLSPGRFASPIVFPCSNHLAKAGCSFFLCLGRLRRMAMATCQPTDGQSAKTLAGKEA